jgi:endonuclease G, mitochondrial
VSWNLNKTTFGSAQRCDCFSSDRSLPEGIFRVVDSDYIGSGYDRGHMVQSESRTQTQQENAATFLFTNILPQAPVNNQQSWLGFENHLNNLARQNGKEVYVIAGGEYSASPQTLNDAGKIQIPEFTWKIAVVMDSAQGLADVQTPADIEVIAIRMPNLISTATSGSWQNVTTTVDAIEEATGYDFLTGLPEWIERIVESGTRPPVAVAGGPYSGFQRVGITFDASASHDPDEGDVLSFAWDFGDGSTGAGVAPTHSYASIGEFTVRLIVSDQFGAADTTYTTAAIVQGLVTGAGTIVVPAGALTANPGAAGLANLSFNAQATEAGFAGQLELNLNAAGFRFTAASITSLAVTGTRATILGTGGTGSTGPVYSFSLAVQGGNEGAGKARIVIRDAAGGVVFDNLPGAAADVLAPVTGSIQVR